MMGAVVASGTGRRRQSSIGPIAGKTGTSQDYRDAWFIGFSAELTPPASGSAMTTTRR